MTQSKNINVNFARIPTTMRAWKVMNQGPIDSDPSPLQLVTTDVLPPHTGEILVRVLTCGVCRTDLHVTEGDLLEHKKHVTPGHEIIVEVCACGPETGRFQLGQRVGIPWLRHTCGKCNFCRSGHENLCPNSKYTGWDHDGGYAEYTTVDEAFAYKIPDSFESTTAAPLLCAGIIGYHAYVKANVPAGGTLGLYGFGGSAHIIAELALKQGIKVHVLTRGENAQKLALKLGASSAAGAYDQPPEQLDSAIIFAPAGAIIPKALEGLKSGGTLALAGIHMTDVPPLNYQQHLFHEKMITSVESNTRKNGEEFLRLASRLKIHPETRQYSLKQAREALRYLAIGDVKGAGVLKIAAD